MVVGFRFSHPSLIDVPFYLAGRLKMVYHLLLYRAFVALRPPEEVNLRFMSVGQESKIV